MEASVIHNAVYTFQWRTCKFFLIPLVVSKAEMLFFFPYFMEASERKRKRKSRWGTEDKKTFIPGMPTTMPPNLSPEQQQAYIGNKLVFYLTNRFHFAMCLFSYRTQMTLPHFNVFYIYNCTYTRQNGIFVLYNEQKSKIRRIANFPRKWSTVRRFVPV